MSWDFFGIKSKKEELLMVLDIGTEAVKVLMVSRGNRGREGVILGSGLSYFDGPDNSGQAVLPADVLKKSIVTAMSDAKRELVLSEAAKNIKKIAANRKKWNVILNLPSSIFRARIFTFSFSREKSKDRISKKEEEEIKSALIGEAKKEAGETFFKEAGILPSDIFWSSQKVIGQKIDGYPVPSICGFNGKEVELKLLLAFIPDIYKETIWKALDSLGLRIVSVMHLAESICLSFENKKRSELFIDIGGTVSQVMGFKSGKLLNIFEIGYGGKNFTDRLSTVLGIREQEAREMMQGYFNGEITKSGQKKIKDMLAPRKIEWYKAFCDKFKESLGEKIFPTKIYLLGGGSMIPDIYEVLSENISNDIGNISGEGCLKISYLESEAFKKFIFTSEKAKSQYIPALMSATCYFSANKR